MRAAIVEDARDIAEVRARLGQRLCAGKFDQKRVEAMIANESVIETASAAMNGATKAYSSTGSCEG